MYQQVSSAGTEFKHWSFRFRIAFLVIAVFCGCVELVAQRNQRPTQPSTTQKSPTAPLRRPIPIQYPPPEIDIPYTEAQLLTQLAREPDSFMTHFWLMCFYAQQWRWEQSLQHALQARRLDSSDINVHLGIIYACVNLGRWQEAHTAVQTALKQSWDAVDRAALLRVKGDLFMDRYRVTDRSVWLERASAAYQQALKVDSTSIQARIGVARVAISRRQYALAKQHLQKALAQVDIRAPGGRRKRALALYYLGIIEETQGKVPQAQKLYEEAVKTHPQSFLPLTEGALIELLKIGLTALKAKQ
ncbi:MAG: tetratricopeptide repeat protein [Fimbriimonadales bacterium]|nr:MAG: hypothetical protein KatS3mg018_1636 [Fimbriimonadales bacterium]